MDAPVCAPMWANPLHFKCPRRIFTPRKMKPADDFHHLGHGLFEWSAFDPAAKVDLHAHALLAGDRLLFVDPIPLGPAAMAELLETAGVPPGPVLLSNANHARHADHFRRRLKVPVLAAAAAREGLRADGLEVDEILEAAPLPGGLSAIPLPGFVPGEVAFFHGDDGGTLRVGDALIHLAAPYDFVPLPDKYCTDPKLARTSLRALLAVNFSRMLFAHGNPLLSGARARLEGMLGATAR